MCQCSAPERWLTVPEWDGFYEVSNRGRVRSVDRVVIRSNGRRNSRRGIVISSITNRSGYQHVGLCRSGDQQTVSVHTLVLRAFVGPPPEGHEVCHDDGNPAHNCLTNLRWDTKTANALDRLRHGTMWQTNLDRCPRGHALESPNLVPSSLPRRQCLACSRGGGRVRVAWRRHGIVLDLVTEADRSYSKIMGVGPEAVRSVS